MAGNESRKWLYDKLSSRGLNIGDFEKFDSLMTNNEDSRKWAYEKARSLGYNVGEDYDQFNRLMASTSAPAKQSQQPTTKPQVDPQPETQVEPMKTDSIRPTQAIQPEMKIAKEQPVHNVEEVMQDMKKNPDDFFVSNSANAEQQQINRIQVSELSTAIDEGLNRRAQELDIEARNKPSRMQPYPEFGMLPPISTGREEDSEYRTYFAAKNALKDAQRIIDEADRSINAGNYNSWLSDTFVGGAARGFGEKFFDVRTWDFGITNTTDNLMTLRALNAFDKGLPLTDAQRMLLDAKAVELATNAYFGSYLGRGYKAGSVTAESIPFMLEMAISPLSTAGSSATSKLARYALSRYAVVKAATRVAGDIAGAAGMAATTGVGRVAGGTLKRMQGKIVPIQTEDGQTVFGDHVDVEDFSTAFAKSFAGTTIENYSEMFGTYFGPILGTVGKGISKGLDKIGLGRVNQLLNDIQTSDLVKLVSDFEKNAQWNGLIGEYAEEVAGNIMNAVVVEDMTLDTAKDTGVFNLDQNIDTFLGVSLLGGSLSFAKTLGYAGSKYNQKRQMDKADIQGSATFGADEWKGIHDALNENADKAKETLSAIMSNPEISNDKKVAALNYAGAVQKYRGAWMISEKKIAENPHSPQSDKDASFDNGYTLEAPQEMNDAKNNLDYHRQNIRRLFGVTEDTDVDQILGNDITSAMQRLGLGNREIETAIQNYFNAKATYDGMIQRQRDDIDTAVAASDATIDSHVSQTDSMIHPAKMNVDDRPVYVVSGNIVMNEDNTGIDRQNSDESIIIVDAETGRKEFTDPASVLSVDPAIDPLAEKQIAQQQIREQMSQQASDKIEGVLAFQPNDQYILTDEQGVQHTAQVVMDNGDGTVAMMLDNVAEPQILSKEAVQQMADMTNLARLNQFEQEKAAERIAQAEAEREAKRPVYRLNDRITLRTADGSTVYGTVTTEADENGMIEVYTGRPIKGKAKVALFSRDELDAMVIEHNGGSNEMVEEQPQVAQQPTGSQSRQSVGESNVSVERQDDRIGRSLTPEEADQVIADMQASAVPAPQIELTPENWDAEFGENGTVKTPIGKVKMGENQLAKLFFNKRESQFGMVKPTLNKPDMIIEKTSLDSNSERDSKYLFIKTFVKPDGGRIVHFESVTVLKEGLEVSISSHEVQSTALKKEMQNNTILHLNEKLSLGSERYLTETPNLEGSDLVPTSDNVVLLKDSFSDSEGRLIEPRNEGSDLVPTPNSSGNKDTTTIPENQETTSILSRIPVDEQGNPQFENAPVQDTWAALVEMNGGDTAEALDTAQQMLSIAQKELNKVQKQKSKGGTNVMEIQRSKDEQKAKVQALQTKVQYWTDVAGFQSEQERMAKIIAKVERKAKMRDARAALDQKGRYAKENAQLRDYLDFRDFVMRSIATGGITFKWADSTTGTKGLGAHLGLKGSRAEMKRRIWMLNNETGEYPEVAAERLLQGYADTISGEGNAEEITGLTSIDALNEVLDVIATYDSPRDMFAAAQERHADIEEDVADYEEELIEEYEPIETNIPTAEEYEQAQQEFEGVTEISSAERTEMENRIVDWLSEENLSFAAGKTREEIFDEFGNELMPIAYIPTQFISFVSPSLKDQRIYCGKGYFIDHALRNHAGAGTQVSVEDVDVSKYLNIQTVLDNPDHIKETYVDGKRTVVFIKKIGRFFAELTQVEENGKVVLHKSFFNQKKEPYTKLNDIRQGDTSSEGGVSSISHATEVAPAISLESRGDVMSSETNNPQTATSKPHGVAISESKDTTISPNSNTLGEKVAQAEAEVNTEPTEKQKEAGNYKKGHVQIGTFNVTIEQPKGSVRSGVDANGNKWETTMQNTYGYIRGTEGVDGDHIDVFLSDDIDGWNGRMVFVVDQVNPSDGSFDEHKVMMGFNDINDAETAYLNNYEDGWQGLGTITGVPVEEFEKWIDSSHRKTKPFAEYKSVKTTEGQSVAMSEQVSEQDNTSYTIVPTQYTTKRGKVLNMHLVKFVGTLTKEQQRAAKELAKADKGWYDREQGGFMMRSEESAQQLANTIIGNEDAVSDVQPVSLADIREVGTATNDVIESETPANSGKPKWEYELTVYDGGRTILERSQIMPDGTPIFDGNFDVRADNPREMLEILRNPANNMQDVIEQVGPRLEQKAQVWDFREKARTEGVNGYKIGEKIVYTYPFNGKEEIGTIHDFDDYGDHNPILDLGNAPVLYVSAEWDHVKKPHQNQSASSQENGQDLTTGSSIDNDAVATAKVVISNPSGNKLVTDERYAELRERMRKKLGGQMNMGIDPEILAIGTEMAVYHVEKGARKFIDYAKAMIEDMGDAIRPYLKAFYNGARELPEVDAAGYTSEMTPYDEVRTFDVANFDKENISAMATAETVAREMEVEQEAEVAQDHFKKLRSKRGKSEKKTVTLQQSLFNNNEDGAERNENSRTDNSGTQLGSEALSDPEQVGARTSVQNATRNSESERRGPRNSRRESGNGPQYDVNKNYTNEEISEIVSSVTDIAVNGKVVITGTITDDIKAICHQYESGGVAKKGRGILDEYYTDGKIVDAVNMLIAPYFKTATAIRVLEPSVGTGNFIEAVKNIPTSEIAAFEINETTARIAKVLYPNVDVNLRSFETEFIDDTGRKKPLPQKYNLVIGNPPYGSHRGFYKGLGEESKIARYEDYFVKRSLDVLDEGGALAMVLPSSWIDRHSKYGSYTIEAAYRLPSGAFEATQVGTDIVVLRKDSSIPVTEHAPYFQQYPERVLGEVKQRKGRYGRMEEYVEGSIDDAIDAIEREHAEALAEQLNIDKTNDNLNDIQSAIEETGSADKAKTIVESEKAAENKPSGKTSTNTRQGKYKVELNRGAETVPTSAQFSHEFSEGEVEAFADTDYDGTVNDPAKHRKYVNYIGGKAIHDFYYAEGDIYSKLAQLEQERGYIVDNFGVEQYEKQKRLLENVLPKQKGLSEITISPNTAFVKNLHISTDEGSTSLKDLFITFLRNLPYEAFGDSSSWEVVGYVQNEQVYGQDKQRNQLIRERRKRVANDLFVKFLNEELSEGARKQVVRAFNREYNAVYRPDYSKVPLFSTINKNFKGRPLKLTSVQLAGIGRMTVKGVGVLAHEVGFGKTLSGVLAMHEAMTRGFAKKPLVIVPNDNILKQWVETINEALPNATVNTLGNLGANYDLTDFEINDGEFTIMTYEGLKAMSFSDATYSRLAARFSYITEDLTKHQSERDAQKRIEKQKELKGKMIRGAKTTYGFEDFGFDWLTFDEVHNANHIVSKVRLDKSVASDFRSQSQRTSDLGLKTWLAAQYIQEENNGRNVLLLSATPFTNKPLEYYSILSLVANKMLERKGFFNVDQFFATFMEADNELEIGANGRPQQKTNVRRFRNNGLFQQLLSEFIDIKGEEDNPELVRPERHNKEYKIAQNDLTAEVMTEVQGLLSDNDTVLQGIGHARAAAFSPYATSVLGQNPKNYREFVKNSPKIDATIKMIEQNKKDRPDAGQIVYSEVGVEFFPMIRDYLVKESGFKPEEVRIITGATSNSERVNIQTAFNDGVVKVVIGSPAIKEGLNLQGNTTDMYILSLPWNFTQLRQIEGRGWRQGNRWENIRINYMLTNDSVDVFMLQRLQLKQGLYNEAMKSGAESLDVSDIDTAELKTALITDPSVRAEIVTVQERAKLNQERTQVEADLSFVTRKYEDYNKLMRKYNDQQKLIDFCRKYAEGGDSYWAERVEREKVVLQKIANEIEQEKQNLLKKGVNVDDIERQTEQARKAIVNIQERIDNLKEYQQELTEKFRKENEAKAEEQGDLLSTYIKERKAENKSGFYKIRPPKNETEEDTKRYRRGDETESRERALDTQNKVYKAFSKFGINTDVVIATTPQDFYNEMVDAGVAPDHIFSDREAVYVPTANEIIINNEHIADDEVLLDNLVHEEFHRLTRNAGIPMRILDAIDRIGESRIIEFGTEYIGGLHDAFAIADEIISKFAGVAATARLDDGQYALPLYMSGDISADQLIEAAKPKIHEAFFTEFKDISDVLLPFVKEHFETLKQQRDEKQGSEGHVYIRRQSTYSFEDEEQTSEPQRTDDVKGAIRRRNETRTDRRRSSEGERSALDNVAGTSSQETAESRADQQRQAVEAAQQLATSLNTPIRIIEDITKIPDPKIKAWYDTKTNEVVLVAPNATSIEDAQQSILHEVVAHKGLRELVGKDHFEEFLDKVFRGADKDTRAKIVALATKNNWNFRLATEEYMAGLAERGFEDRTDRNFFEKVRDLFLDMLRRAKIALGYRISDNDLRYMLWRSYQMQRSKGAMAVAEDVDMQRKLGVGNFRTRQMSEEEQIVAQAKKDGTYLKAPNGQPTNLTPKQWAQVRTKAFKKWFGDWEKAARIEKLKKSTSIEVDFENQYELARKSAKEWLKQNIKGEYVNTDTGEHIEVSNVGINEVTSHGSQSEEHLKSLVAIPQMIEGAIFIDELPNRKDHDKYDSYRYYVCGVKIDGVDYTAKIVVGVKGDSKYYDHRLTQIEKGSLIDNLNGLSNSVAENQDSLVSVSKDTKLNEILQTNASKVVDANGEPKVVYHRTPNEFTKFDPEKSHHNSFGKGFYFANQKSPYVSFGRHSMSCWLMLNNPILLNEQIIHSILEEKYGTETYSIPYEDRIKALDEYVKHSGYDGVIYSGRAEYLDEYVAFTPSQIKSATDNIGTFNSSNDDIRYRRASVAPPSSGVARQKYNKAVRSYNKSGEVKRFENMAYRLREAYQDSMLSLRELYSAILEETGNDLHDFEDAYKAENRMSSENKAQAEIYMRDYYKPLQDAVRGLIEEGAEYNDIVRYMIAKHGLERNEVFSKRDAEKDGGTWDGEVKRDYSGLTELTQDSDNFTDLAQQMVDDFESEYDTTIFWDRVNAATKETLRKSYESGLYAKDTYEQVRDMFQFYIPLRGWDANVAANEYEYLSSNRLMLSPTLKTARGRRSIADDPLATIGYMAESAIVQGNRNLMKQKFLNFVLNNPTSLATVSEQWYVKNAMGVWEPHNPFIPEDATADEVAAIVEQHEQDMEALGDNATKERAGLKLGLHATKWEGQQHTIRVSRNGKEYLIFINGNPTAAMAINGLTNPNSELNSVEKAAMWVKNFMARAFTSQNPAFIFTNLSRDVIWAGTAVAIKEDKKYTAQYTKNISGALLKGRLPRLIHKFQKGTLDTNVEIERYFEEFIRNGGETGFTQINTVEDYKRNMKRFIEEAQGGKTVIDKVTKVPKKAWRWAWDGIEFMNRSAEDTTRFMVYMTSRQMGRSISQSVWDAKEVTVNFNKKGRGTLGASVMNFAYIFFNATIQGLANFGNLMAKHPIKTTLALSSFTSAGFIAPMLAIVTQAMFGDDDDRNGYWDLPEWVRRNNIVLYLPFTDNGYITIPLPHEVRPFYGMGELAFSCLMGKETVENAISKAIQGFASLLPLDYTGNAGNMAVNFTPTIAQPFAQLIANKDYFGKPIYRKNDYNELDPEWTKAYKGTNAFLVSGAKWLNETSGGDNVKSGRVDTNPAVIEHIFESYLGGMGKTVNKTFKTLSMLWDEDAREWRNVPVISSFYQEAEERTTGSQLNREYFEALEEAKDTEHLYRGYRKQLKMGAMEYAEKLDSLISSPIFQRYKMANGYKKAISKLNDALKMATPEEREELETAIMELKAEMLDELKKLPSSPVNR